MPKRRDLTKTQPNRMYPKTVLPNGLRVISHQMKERDSIALGFWIGVGGRYEKDPMKGAAHFLEHMAFKGSRKYSCEKIKELVEGVGGMLNAFTSEEQTCFYAKIPSLHLDQTFDVLADMIVYPQIAESAIAKEKTVILEEIKMYRDLPQYFVLELLDELLWPGHPLGRNLAGTAETVTAMSREDLHAFHEIHYVPGNVVISACGRVNHQRIVNLAKKKLDRIDSAKRCSYIKADNSQAQPRVKLFRKDIEQMHVAFGALGFDENHKDRHALSLLSVILGGNMSSRLFVEIREKRGLAYSISSASKTMHDTGLFLIRAGVDNQKVTQTMALILKELEKIKRKGVAGGEFTRAKDYLLGQILLGLEDTMEHMLWIGETLISKDKVKTLKSLIADFRKTTQEDIRRVARDVLKENRYNLAVVGPLSAQQEKELTAMMNTAV